jgi:hypothetical protein
MKQISVLCLATVCAIASGCALDRAVSLPEGTFRLKSAVLINQGKMSELVCQGDFFIVVTKDAELARVQPLGSATCPAPNPASFVETLGGDCEQSPVELSPTRSGLSYSETGVDWSCASRSSALLEYTLDGVSADVLRVTRRNIQLSDLNTELVFSRTDDVL